MKELLVEVGKVGEIKDAGDPMDEWTGSAGAPEDLMQISVRDSEDLSKLSERDSLFSRPLLYNIPYGWLHGREYYTQNCVEVNPYIRIFTRKIAGGKNGKAYQNFRLVLNMAIAERLRFLRTHLSLTQDEFANRIGKSLRTIQNWESGQTEPNDKTLRLISHTFGVSYEWLKTGEGEMFIKPKPNARLIPEEEIVWVPIVARVGAGYPVDQGDVEVKGHFPVPRHVWESLPKGTYTTEVVGDSMEPTLHEGDVVAAKPYEGSGDDIPNGKVVIVADASGELVVKRLKHINGRPVLTSDNPKYEPIYPNHEHRIIGVAIKAWKGVDL